MITEDEKKKYLMSISNLNTKINFLNTKKEFLREEFERKKYKVYIGNVYKHKDKFDGSNIYIKILDWKKGDNLIGIKVCLQNGILNIGKFFVSTSTLKESYVPRESNELKSFLENSLKTLGVTK